MGKKKKNSVKVVLDTNVLVSALLFKGRLSKLVQLWKTGRLVPVVSRETFYEFKVVLRYPKFSLSEREIKTIIEEEVLPYFEVAEVKETIKGVCRDPDDNKFISCAISSSANFIISGDKDLYDLKRYKFVKIMKASDFLKMYLLND